MQRFAVAFLSTLVVALSTHAATFTVSSSADSGPGTLRQAILDSNGIEGADQIVFTTPSVVATSEMPAITDTVHVDGAVGSGRVDIQGVPSSGASAFEFHYTGSTLTNVSVRAYPQPLELLTTNVTVTNSAFENTSYIAGSGHTLTGNTFSTLDVFGSNTIIEDNVIGRVKVVSGSNNRIGSIGNGNTIGNAAVAVAPDLGSVMVISAGYTFIEGNEIASDWDTGIYLADSGLAGGATISGNTIHGQVEGLALGKHGAVGTFRGARILGNSIYDVGIPIDLYQAGGPTPNDPAPDADDGGNRLQNYPVLTSAVSSAASMNVSGTLTSAPLTTYRIELFGNPASAPDEARTPLTTFDVTTDASGNAAFTQTLPPVAGALTSTATNLTTDDTSEVSAPVVVEASGQLSFNPTAYNANEGSGEVVLTVVRTGGTLNTVTATYTTVNGTATAPNDFTSSTGTITFGSGVTSQTIVIPITGDQIGEPAETFTVTLSNPTNGAMIGNGTATVTIAAEEGGVPIPTASTWALIALAITLAVAAAGALRS